MSTNFYDLALLNSVMLHVVHNDVFREFYLGNISVKNVLDATRVNVYLIFNSCSLPMAQVLRPRFLLTTLRQSRTSKTSPSKNV